MTMARPGAVAMLAALCAVWPAVAGATGAGEGAARALVETTHAGPVLGLEYDDARGMLVSAGADGTVRIWDAVGQRLLRMLEVTRLDATRLAVDPQSPRVAVVLTDHTGAFSLSVWNWEEQRQLYRIPLREEPLFVRFSGQGTYLLYGESSWQGLTILKSADGSVVSFHPEGFGIVGFAEMSKSEKTLLTYLVSGRLIYWDLATGASTLELSSVPLLSEIHISRDKRFLVGTNGREVVVVDAVTGGARARAPAAGVVSLDISAANDRVAAVAGSPPALLSFTFKGDTLSPVAGTGGGAGAARAATPLTRASFGMDTLYVADSTGSLLAVDAAGRGSAFGVSRLAGLTGFAVGQRLLAVASPSFMRVLQSDLLQRAVAPTYIRTFAVANPFAAPTGLAPASSGALLAWRMSPAPPALALVDPVTAALTALPNGFKGPLDDLRSAGSLVLGMETGGQLRLAELATGVSRYEMRIAGAGTALVGPGTQLIAGRTSPAGVLGSLVRLDTRTGETVGIRDGSVYTYALALDQRAGAPVLYTVGVDEKGGTSLLRHEGQGFETSTVLDSVPAEVLDVSEAVDPSLHRLYATLGVDRLVAGDGVTVSPLPLGNTSPVRLAAADGLLYALTRAGTVSIADGATGEQLAELFVFDDSEWAIVFPDGRYAASTGGDVRVRVFVDGDPVKATEDFRLRLEAR
jgi:hypothetical protein